ncbi:VapC toxin family PIN domain ribonuclease [Halobacteriales archaeon QS_4_69_34]|nr:MAG: VapC toxin family PIN domain ribonuclease [Halobacteriales archaeon QS_4_69_34]
MYSLDGSYLIDYLTGRPGAEAFLDTRDHEPFGTPTPALYEAYRGAALSAGPETVADLGERLDWVTPQPLTEAAAREAAVVEATLVDRGEAIAKFDYLIAGIVRAVGGTLVTADPHFERVDGLEVERYR